MTLLIRKKLVKVGIFFLYILTEVLIRKADEYKMCDVGSVMWDKEVFSYLQRKLEVLKGHCTAVSRSYEDIEKTVVSYVKISPDDVTTSEVIEFCQKGPPSAIVEKVDVFWEDYIGDIDDFRIIR